jgi:hypothetical protein
MASASLRIEAVVDGAERGALSASAEQLGECLGAATQGSWPVELRFHESIGALEAPDRPTLVICSLLADLDRHDDEPIATTEARWRKDLAALPDGFLCVFVCTIFRCTTLARGGRHVDGMPALAERIRRLNLLAAELSHDAGVGVIDIDRVFAHIGARALATDHRLSGPLAADVAGHAIVSGLLAMGLDEVAAPEVQARAKHFHGDVSTVLQYVAESRQRSEGA